MVILTIGGIVVLQHIKDKEPACNSHFNSIGILSLVRARVNTSSLINSQFRRVLSGNKVAKI